ncbi:hypothetical protein V5O48_017675 [Marasmius crinis-equi]|uniref:Uncharacterized protein n=1 Tax=Marasmius crinis-equi TaxID=585013 RepID=A0ABR3ENA1_9AGAR
MFHWPNRQLEWADSVLYELPFLEDLTRGCLARDNTTVSAQWIRAAFHNMATHNIDYGTGGLDGSLAFELDRPASEGIALTACGHALGGVLKKDFPDILKKEEFQSFNEKTILFNNDVVTQYLDGTPPNPLVVGVNNTMNSDFRLFSSDGNAMMQSLSSPEEYNKICADLYERMINTVPATVTLTEVIDPWDYKVREARFSVANGTDSLVMSTTLRLLNAQENPDRKVSGAPLNVTNLLTTGYGKTPLQYTFTVENIDPVKSIGTFWFEIDDGSEIIEVKNNDGNGYVIAEAIHDVLFDIKRSTLFSTPHGANFTADIVITVKNKLVGGTPISLQTINSFVVPYT